MPSKSIDDYEFGPTLGKGSFGEVKVAINIYTNQEVAIKIVDNTRVAGEENLHQLREEIRILSLLDHRHVVKLYDVIETQCHVYIVLELIEGQELSEYLLARKRLTEDEARRLFQQIIDGVEHCHSRKVAHRDLKLENILVDNDNTVKIIDFGLAAEIHVGELLTKQCGSLHYVAPEILSVTSSSGYDGPAVDVWSCGVVLFALLRGRLPFGGDTQPDIERSIEKGRYMLPEYVTDKGKDLVTKMLTKDRYERISIPQIRKHAWLQGLESSAATIASGAGSPVSNLLTTAFVLFELGRPPKEQRGGWVSGTTAASIQSWRGSFVDCSNGRRLRHRPSPRVDAVQVIASRSHPSSSGALHTQALSTLASEDPSSFGPGLLTPDLLTPDFVLYELGRPPRERKGGWVGDATAIPNRQSVGSSGGCSTRRRRRVMTTRSIETWPVASPPRQEPPRETFVVPTSASPSWVAPDLLTTNFVMFELGQPTKSKGGWVRDSVGIPHRPRRCSSGGCPSGCKVSFRARHGIDVSC